MVIWTYGYLTEQLAVSIEDGRRRQAERGAGLGRPLTGDRVRKGGAGRREAHSQGMPMYSSCYGVIGLAAVVAGGLMVTAPGIGGAQAAEPLAKQEAAAPQRRTDGDSRWVARRDDLESVLGREVRTRVEEDLGRIIDLLVDRSGQVQAAVIEFGGFLGIGTRKIAVEWSALRFDADGKQRVIVEVNRDQLRTAPEYKPTEPAIVGRASE